MGLTNPSGSDRSQNPDEAEKANPDCFPNEEAFVAVIIHEALRCNIYH